MSAQQNIEGPAGDFRAESLHVGHPDSDRGAYVVVLHYRVPLKNDVEHARPDGPRVVPDGFGEVELDAVEPVGQRQMVAVLPRGRELARCRVEPRVRGLPDQAIERHGRSVLHERIVVPEREPIKAAEPFME